VRHILKEPKPGSTRQAGRGQLAGAQLLKQVEGVH